MPDPSSPSAPELKDPSLSLDFEVKLPTSVLAADIAPDDSLAFLACLDGGVYSLDLASKTYTRILQHQSYASGVRFLPASGVLVSAGYDGVVRWTQLQGSKPLHSVQAHTFWSWDLAISPDQTLAASVGGQYLAGGPKYEPASAAEPTVRVYRNQDASPLASWALTPPVLAVAFSPDSRLLAAANLLGDIRVWDLKSLSEVASWNTPDFTSWGIIKSHHYVGGVFSLAFDPDGLRLAACGMGPMRDPMAGNGKQTWQLFDWRVQPPARVLQIHESDHGNGLMETLQFHPSVQAFLMAGRLAQGKWNVALFHSRTGRLLHGMDSKMRVTEARFFPRSSRVLLAGTVGQEKKKDGQCPEFGRVKIYTMKTAAA